MSSMKPEAKLALLGLAAIISLQIVGVVFTANLSFLVFGAVNYLVMWRVIQLTLRDRS